MHLTQNWEIRKPGVSSRGGIVASQNATAARVGAEILAAGGTTVDAAVATALALAAVEPWNSGLGGIGFMVVQQAGAERAEVVDFGPISPSALDPAAYPLTGEMRTELFTWPQVVGDRNIHGPLSFMIPSAVRGYALALERFGRMPWHELVAPAISLARAGLPVDWFTTVKVASAAADLRRYEESRRVWLPDSLPPVCPPDADHANLPLGRLAETLERLAKAGPDDFYQGEIARSITADTRAVGGALSAEDLGRYRARIVPALDIPYRGTTFQTTSGMTAGPTLARILGQLAERHFGGGIPDATYFEAVIDILRHAYAERLETMGDVEAGAPTSTTHITAVDRQGGLVALTTTLLSSFGSRYVLPGTGILMNNGVMWFDPQPGRPNSIGPGKRALTNMCPVVVARDRRPWLGVGASGGRRILGAVLQLASFVVDFGMEPFAAAHHPRVDVNGSDRIGIDRRLPAAIVERLSALPGATLVEHGAFPARFACPNLVLRGADGVNHGISDVMSPWSAAVAEPERA
ncbi:MAG: gamma-glutamyltransferase [Alphaproteobacteria bacterium]|nr:gamma-glutamyltransferase [Alphaproteobacteria bacterium]